jgi:hypothetical protein
VLRLVLSYLDLRELAEVTAVSWRFAHIARDESLWAAFGGTYLTSPELLELQVSHFGGNARRTLMCHASSVLSAKIAADLASPSLDPADVRITVRILPRSQVKREMSFPLAELPVRRGSATAPLLYLDAPIAEMSREYTDNYWDMEVFAINLRTGNSCRLFDKSDAEDALDVARFGQSLHRDVCPTFSLEAELKVLQVVTSDSMTLLVNDSDILAAGQFRACYEFHLIATPSGIDGPTEADRWVRDNNDDLLHFLSVVFARQV